MTVSLDRKRLDDKLQRKPVKVFRGAFDERVRRKSRAFAADAVKLLGTMERPTPTKSKFTAPTNGQGWRIPDCPKSSCEKPSNSGCRYRYSIARSPAGSCVAGNGRFTK